MMGPTNDTITNFDNPVAEKGNLAKDYSLSYTIGFSEENLIFEKLLGYDLVTMNDCSVLNEPGKPLMPVYNIRIALPNGMQVTQVKILSLQQQVVKGMYTIVPAQQPLPVETLGDQNLPLLSSRATYFSLRPYPSGRLLLGAQSDLAGQSMIDVSLYPLHYLPLQKKLILTTSISFILEGVQGYICKDYLPHTISSQGRMMYEQMVKEMVINPDSIELRTSPLPQPMGVGPGEYDYVIITQDIWVSAFQPLADWKTKKGVPTKIVTTDWIYNNGGYSGTDVEKIQAFVQDVYETWGTTYVLLGGDIDVVPCNYRTFPGVDSDPVPNDAFYADFDDDWICEVNIGRASVTGTGSGTGQIGNFISKILTYETDPPLTNYATNAGFFGFDLDSSTHTEQCKSSIKNDYLPVSWTVTTVYDSQGGNHRTNVINALNAGQNLVNHADHSNNDCMGTGYVHHDWLIYSSDMDDLTNGNKQTILYSMGCDPAAYDVSNCIAEHFVRNSNGGGIAFIGNSRYGWYNPGNLNTLSLLYDIHFFKSLFQEQLYNLGAAFSDHKNDVIQDNPGEDIYQYIYTELTLLGDPELPVWTANPGTLSVSHPSTIPFIPSSFTVHVETTTGTDIANACVCVVKEDEVYERGFTNSNGNVTFSVDPDTLGYVNVTATKHNYLPAESTIEVVEVNLPPYEPCFPTPFNGATNTSLSPDLSWMCGDPNPEDTVTYNVYFGSSSTPPLVANNQSTKAYDPGTLNYLTTYFWKIVAWDNNGAFTEGLLWSFTTKANNPPVFGTPSPANGSINNPLSFLWSIPITDPEGNTITWSIQCSNGQTNSGTGATNGTKSLTLTGLSYSTTYKVWVNATDSSGSGTYSRRWYLFTTLANQPPTFGDPSPANGSINVPLEFIWSIPINDPEGDLFSWTIQCNNGQTNSGTGASNGTKSLALSGLIYSKSYKVWVNATDPSGSGTYTRHWYTFNTGDDIIPPVTTIVVTGTMGHNGWYISPISFTLSASDTQSGVDHIYYKIDYVTWLEYSAPVELNEDGNHVILYYAVDKTGNEEPVKTANISIDQTAPQINLIKQEVNLLEITFIAQVNDETSGIDRVEFSLDGQLQSSDTAYPYEWTFTGIGNHQINATVFDLAGNSKSQSLSTPYDYTLSKNLVYSQSQKFLIK
jgi:hypothetical protein